MGKAKRKFPKAKHFKTESLGRPAVFLLPSKKTDKKLLEEIRSFLLNNFGAYTETAPGTFHGFWKDIGEMHYDEHIRFEVSFKGKERIPLLFNFLAGLTIKLKEACIYAQTGEDSWLIYPR